MIILGVALILAGLSFAGYNFWDQNRAGESAQAALDKLVVHIPEPEATSPKEEDIFLQDPQEDDSQILDPQEIEYPNYVLNPKMDMPIMEIDGFEYVGYLEIPSLELKLPVINTWSEYGANFAPCRYTGTAYLDNMVICAHNFSTHFGRLNTVIPGDLIYFTDMDGYVFTYEVIESEILQPTQIEEMCVGDWDLSLFTCTWGGRTRFTVRCEKIDAT